MARQCVFCGATGTTKEHIWPKWLASMDAVFPSHSILHKQVRQGRQWLAKPFTLVTRAVCGQCNSGWMGELEAAAKPNLIPLIMGRAPLYVPAQAGRTIASRAFKTSMMFHSTMPDVPVIPAEHHRQLYELRRPPHFTYAFIGRYTGTEYLMGRYHCNPLAIGRGPDDELPDGRTATALPSSSVNS